MRLGRWPSTGVLLTAGVIAVSCEARNPTALQDVCPNIPGTQTSGPCQEPPSPEIRVSLQFPIAEYRAVEGRVIDCPLLAVETAHLPGGAILDTAFTVDGDAPFSCDWVNGVKQLHVGVPAQPAGATLAVGLHVLSVAVSLRGRPLVMGRDTAAFEILPTPDQLIVTVLNSTPGFDGPSDFWSLDDLPSAVATRLTNTPGEKLDPALSPDGKALIYWVFDPNEGCGPLVRANADGTDAVPYELQWEGRKVCASEPVFSPDGSMIAFHGGTLGEFFRRGYFVMKTTGEDLHRFRASTYTTSGLAWLPDGQHVVVGYGVLGWIDDNQGTGIVRWEYVSQNVTTGATRDLLITERGDEAFGAFVRDVSPNGEWLLLFDYFDSKRFILTRTDGSGESHSFFAWSEGEPQVAGRSPVFCSGGNEICYQTGYSIWSVDLFGGARRFRFKMDPSFGWVHDLYMRRIRR